MLEFLINIFIRRNQSAMIWSQIVPNITVEYSIDKQKITIKKLVPSANQLPQKLVIPETIKIKKRHYVVSIIESNAFINSSISKIRLPSSVFAIKDNAFANCYFLTEANLIETKIKIIPFGLFANCTHLEKIYLPKSTVAIGNYAFANTNISNVFIPSTTQHIRGGAFINCNNIDNITIHPDNNFLKMIGSSIYSKNEFELILANTKDFQYEISELTTTIGFNAFSGSPIKEIVIPKNTKKICAEAFSDCKNLRTIRISNGVHEIQRRAFSGLDIRIISLPSSVDQIGEYTFDSSNIKIIDMHNTVISTLPSHVFNKISGLQELWLPLTINDYKLDFLYGTSPFKIYYCGRITFSKDALPKGTNLICDKPRDFEL